MLAAPEMNGQFTLQQYCLRLLANPRSQLHFWCAHSTVMFFLVTITIFTLSFFFFLNGSRETQGCLCLHFSQLLFHASTARYNRVKAKQELRRAGKVLFFSETTRSFCYLTSTCSLSSSSSSLFLYFFQRYCLFCLPQLFHF